MPTHDQPNAVLIDPSPTLTAPYALLAKVVAEISEIEELQTILAIVRISHDQGGPDQPLAEKTIERERWLRRALRTEGSPNSPADRIAKGISLAAGRGTILRFTTRAGGETRVWYYLNTIENQTRLSQMATGAVLPPDELQIHGTIPVVEPEQPNVFRLYEQNISLLTPLVAERIVGALERYPSAWIEEAIGEAVTYNRRNWRYIARILENWAVAGRGDGVQGTTSHEKDRRHHANTLDPDQYRDGRHLDRTGRG